MKRIWKRIGIFFASTFSVSFDILKRNSALAVKVTNELKKYVESPMADLAINLIPGNWDNAAVITLRKVLPGVVTRLAIIKNIATESTVPSQCTEKIIEYLKTLNKDARVGFWIEFAGRLNKALADSKLTFAEAVILSQLAYKELYESRG